MACYLPYIRKIKDISNISEYRNLNNAEIYKQHIDSIETSMLDSPHNPKV